MHSASPFSRAALLGAALALAACGGSGPTSPVSPGPIAAGADDAGAAVSADGYGPGGCTSGCTSDPAAGNGYGPGPGPSDGFCGSACTGPVGPEPDDIVPILERALQEEYGVEMLYRGVLASFGDDTAPFAAIADAESRHVLALAQLFARRGLAAPGSVPVAIPSFASLAEACAAGVAAEQADAAFYAPYLERGDLPLDVRSVFTNLQAASLQNHLPAFERCQ
jgi:hypothetical protein